MNAIDPSGHSAANPDNCDAAKACWQSEAIFNKEHVIHPLVDPEPEVVVVATKS